MEQPIMYCGELRIYGSPEKLRMTKGLGFPSDMERFDHKREMQKQPVQFAKENVIDNSKKTLEVSGSTKIAPAASPRPANDSISRLNNKAYDDRNNERSRRVPYNEYDFGR